MEDLTQNYWNNRYLNNDFGWDIGDVSLPLRTYIEQIKDKNCSILIPGAGNSYEAELLFNLGFKNVVVLDFAKEPLLNIKKRLPDFPDEQLMQQDFFEHQGQYDLIIEQTFFCAINPNLRPKYVQKMYELLKPKGKLVGLLFNAPMNEDKPPFGGNSNEYQLLFQNQFTFKVFETCYNSIKPREGKELFIVLEKA